MNLINVASELFLKELGSSAGGLNADSVGDALQNLLPTNGGDLDFAALVQQFSGGDLGNLVQSFLGDGGNLPMSARMKILNSVDMT